MLLSAPAYRVARQDRTGAGHLAFIIEGTLPAALLAILADQSLAGIESSFAYISDRVQPTKGVAWKVGFVVIFTDSLMSIPRLHFSIILESINRLEVPRKTELVARRAD